MKNSYDFDYEFEKTRKPNVFLFHVVSQPEETRRTFALGYKNAAIVSSGTPCPMRNGNGFYIRGLFDKDDNRKNEYYFESFSKNSTELILLQKAQKYMQKGRLKENIILDRL